MLNRNLTKAYSHSEMASTWKYNQQEKEDPMAWADWIEFGGTKVRQDPRKLKRQLTSEEIKIQLRDLEEIEHKTIQARQERCSRQEILHTIKWLRQNSLRDSYMEKNDDAETAAAKQKKKKSIMENVRRFFSNKRKNQQQEETQEQEEPKWLEEPWGQQEMRCTWSQVGFSFLNQPIYEDIARVRHVLMMEDEWENASNQALPLLEEWFQSFDQHVQQTIAIKDELLQERMSLAGVGYKVVTQYEMYHDELAKVFASFQKEDVKELREVILSMFTMLESILKDEILAVEQVLTESLSEDLEYEALSNLFHHFKVDSEHIIIIVKLLAWAKNNLSQQDMDAFELLMSSQLRKNIQQDGMQTFSQFMQVLTNFQAQIGILFP